MQYNHLNWVKIFIIDINGAGFEALNAIQKSAEEPLKIHTFVSYQRPKITKNNIIKMY